MAIHPVTDRWPRSGISILIVGAGTAGLFAALECWRKGHDVRVLEKAPEPYSAGDGYSIGPSAVKVFCHWHGMVEMNDHISYDPRLVKRTISGEVLENPSSFFDKDDKDAPLRSHRHLRPRFQSMLMGYTEKIGIIIEWNNVVKSYFEDLTSGKGGVVLSDGTRITSDLVIAADGIGTKSYEVVTGTSVPAQDSGYSIYRCAFPVQLVAADPALAERFPETIDGEHVIEMWSGHGMYGTVWRTDDSMVWTITHKDNRSSAESWSKAVDPQYILDLTAGIPGWPEDRNKLIRATPADKITDFKLVWRDPQPDWVSSGGRVVQIGDAAHTFLPSSGSGATQGIEDAVSLATCLQIGGKHNIPSAARVHNLLRCDRINCAQLMGLMSQNNRNISNHDSASPSARVKQTKAYGKWLWSHDPEKYAVENYEKALFHLNEGVPFQNTNIPPGYICKPWTIAELIDRPEETERLTSSGDWN